MDQNSLQVSVGTKLPIPRTLDEQADSAARKCLMYYGPNNNPRLTIGPRNQVTVDAGGKIHLIDDLDVYRKSVGKGTWNAVIKLADELREKKIKIGFFSSTPQGGAYFRIYPHFMLAHGSFSHRRSRSCGCSLFFHVAHSLTLDKMRHALIRFLSALDVDAAWCALSHRLY